MTINTFPLLAAHRPGDAIAWRANKAVSQNQFLAHVSQLADALPDRRYAINLCTDRYHFMVAFAAVIVRGQCNLLPPSPAPRVLADIAGEYADSYCITDEAMADLPVAEHRVDPGLFCGAAAVLANPRIAADHVAALAFTSGSTGRARANPKTWGSLVTGAQLARERFGIDRENLAAIVATVPPQHMYGLETSIMLPLVSGVGFSAERPLFPADIHAALAAVPSPRVLVTTPVHLRTCVRAGLKWPPIAFIISATAPMPMQLASETETVLQTQLLEIYGATEVGSMASRRTLDGALWRLYDGMLLREAGNRFFVSGPNLADEVALSDMLRQHDATHFELLGRCADMVLIAGKRMSLADLNHKLNDIDGVEDGVFFVPEEADDGTVKRLVAFVVAPGLAREQIYDALAERLDPLFLPRPLVCVERLPRNETGKLPRANLLALLSQRSATA
ncbi:MAG: acyl-CoA synthetase [Pseudomonadota bacterium]|nr:MAG: acyl-CoA synthetase [Pseudomonadota bacterium]